MHKHTNRNKHTQKKYNPKTDMRKIRLHAVGILIAIAGALGWADAPRYVFYFIGDGMGMGPTLAAENYQRDVLGKTEPLTMLQFPTVAWCQTRSASSTTTDSAAGGTALATGHKTRNGMLGMAADSTAVESVATTLHNAGWGVGVITTVAADDATPGAFYAHVPSRHHYYDICLDAARSGFEFLAGAGLKGLDSERHDDVAKAFKKAGVQMVYGPKGISEIKSQRAVLLNVERGRTWNVGYTVDSIPGVLTLPMMTGAAIAHLEKHTPERFFLMAEAGNIDHALHANDGGAAVVEIINFNEAIKLAYDFYLEHPDETLIVVTADHDTGGMAMGNNTVGYSSAFGNVAHQRISKDVMNENLKQMLADGTAITWEEMRASLSDKLGLFTAIKVSPEKEEMLKEKFSDTFEKRNSADKKTLYASFDAFAESVFNLWNDLTGYGFTSNAHTGNPVPLFAIGKGSDRFNSLNDNTEIAPAILELTGVK